jgi:hypothetical protein
VIRPGDRVALEIAAYQGRGPIRHVYRVAAVVEDAVWLEGCEGWVALPLLAPACRGCGAEPPRDGQTYCSRACEEGWS